MEWMMVLSGGTQLRMSKESAAALVQLVARGAQSGATFSIEDGVLVRVQDVQLFAPNMSSPPAQQVKVQARVATTPRKQA